MAFCKNCGTDIGDANVCSACGAVQVAETVVTPVTAPVETPSFSADPASYSTSDIPVTPVAPVTPVGYQSSVDAGSSVPTYSSSYSAMSEEMPSTTGMMVFSIINIVLGVLLCCCAFGLPLVGTVLGIIALVFTIQAGKMTSAEEAKAKLKTAKLLNIIGVCATGLGVIGSMIWSVANGSSSANYMSQFGDFSDYY